MMMTSFKELGISVFLQTQSLTFFFLYTFQTSSEGSLNFRLGLLVCWSVNQQMTDKSSHHITVYRNLRVRLNPSIQTWQTTTVVGSIVLPDPGL